MRWIIHLGMVALALGGHAGFAWAQFHGAWLPEPGVLIPEIDFIHQVNQQWFCGENRGHCEIGERDVASDLTTREESTTTSFYFKTEFSPRKHLSFKAEVPFHFLFYERYSGQTLAVPPLDSSGPGDILLSVRTGTQRGLWAVSGGYGIEFPTGDFSPSTFIIPVGQGTRNHQFFAEIGRSLYPLSGYVQTGVLYRIREAFVSEFGVRTNWGNELYAKIEAGFRVHDPVWVKRNAKGMKSERFTTSIIGEPPGDFQSIWVLQPGVFASKGNLVGELWATIPMAGRNWPSDASLGVKIVHRFDLFPGPSPAVPPAP